MPSADYNTAVAKTGFSALSHGPMKSSVRYALELLSIAALRSRDVKPDWLSKRPWKNT